MQMFEKQGERNRGGREGGREREGERGRKMLKMNDIIFHCAILCTTIYSI